MVNIRHATLNDLPRITEIYNDAVLHTTATFDMEIKTVDDRIGWFTNRDKNFPIIVAEKNQLIVAYAALNRWSERKAYDITGEISLYVDAPFRKQGIGKLLIEMLIAEAEQTNLHSIIARIAEGNEQSIYLHKLNGFAVMGVMKQAGLKFGKLLDVTFMQKMLR